MASQQFANKLQEELTCPICMDILKGPVTVDCGHNFCLTCITQSAEMSDGSHKCPLCNMPVKNTYSPNWLLMNLIEKIGSMDFSGMQPQREDLKCPTHEEKFHYFCENDGEFLCMVCCKTKEHKLHNSILIEEAAQNYKEQIQAQVAVLRQKEKMIEQIKEQGEQKIHFFRTQVASERQRILTEFSNLERVLNEEKKFLLSRIDWLGQQGTEGRRLYVTFLETQLKSLSQLTNLLQAKQQMPPKQLLRDIRFVLNRSRGFQFLNPIPVPPDLDKKLSEAKSRHDSLQDSLRRFKDNLQADGKKDQNRFFKGMNRAQKQNWHQLEKNKSEQASKPESSSPGMRTPEPGRPGPLPSALRQPRSRDSLAGPPATLAQLPPRRRESFAAVPPKPGGSENAAAGSLGAAQTAELPAAPTPVTLDVASAHPDLIISTDLKTVTLDLPTEGGSKEPSDPERFYPFHCVLGSARPGSGRQAWEVELHGPGGGACLVGVASDPVPRQGYLLLAPAAGFWVLRLSGDDCHAIVRDGSREKLPVRPRKVGVCVDYESGEVVFYDATTRNHIYTFQAFFPGQVFPFFRLLSTGTQVTLNP
ncbi:E3 ubiquitin-protein ligase TRIM31 [Tupaia chinensis]|uniref:E3 ubiquitin-protein ligase TRIM31 n=1 Tax=Tupaia chinensis TaxID=246437 RepID=UPI000703F839|nr:E3 ubiquitin-protein ligase TRIM31 [Tupaia chinensis]